MNDTDRKIVNSLKEIGAACCLNCGNSCESEDQEERDCIKFGQYESPRCGFEARLTTKAFSVCDLWEKRT